MKNYVKGTFKRLIFSSKDGFIVGLIKIKETNDQELLDYIDKQFTFTGLFHELNIDEDYVFYGEVVDNAKYGIQLKVCQYEKVKPEGKDGLIAFLSSEIFLGIGEKTAILVVETLGEDCLEQIEKSANSLLLVPKMTSKKALQIRSALLKYNESYKTIAKLTDFGFNMKDSLKIYNHYYDDSIRVIESNPYELIDTIDGFSFIKIDSLRNKTNIEKTDERRMLALVIHTIKTMCFQSGNTYLLKDEILRAMDNYLDEKINNESAEYYLIKLNKLGKIIIEGDKYVFFDYYHQEKLISDFVYELTNKSDYKVVDIELKIEKLERFFNIEYNEEQKRAIKQAIVKNFSIITGGPGTGKTTIIKGIVQLYSLLTGYSYEKLCERMVLLAPTGRAAKRMSEACLFKASTIHRYLKWNKETNEFQYNETNKVNVEFLIVDETSMIDTELLSGLFRALPSNVKIVFIGDYNQLESVGPGKILKDLIDSQMINTISLKEIYRQDENSYIVDLAYEVNEGELSEAFLNKKDDYNFIRCEVDEVLNATCKVFKKAIDKGYDLKNVQVLAPVYKGQNGIDNLNKSLQLIFNPKDNEKKEIYDGGITYRENDKILQLENMPDDNVFNGDIGFIKKIDKDEI
ncbi:MAG: AAA family ATPase, partial [Bacilli bacterium]